LDVSPTHFLMARLVRIIPAYVVGLALSGPFFYAGLRRGDATLVDIPLVTTMMQAWWPPTALAWNSPAWSLSNEWAFYLLFPTIWLIGKKLSRLVALILAAALVAATEAVRELPGNLTHNFLAYHPLMNVGEFMIGIVLAKIFMSRSMWPRQNILFAVASCALLVCIAGKSTYPMLAHPPLLDLLFAALIFSLTMVTRRTLKLLSHPVLVTLGEASYALYIIHLPLWMWWDRLTRVDANVRWSLEVDFTLYLLCTLAVALGVLTLIEQPSRRFWKIRILVKPPQPLEPPLVEQT
jgi:peptidoglycan/LPS O-acetylase OafA/YrhL